MMQRCALTDSFLTFYLSYNHFRQFEPHYCKTNTPENFWKTILLSVEGH